MPTYGRFDLAEKAIESALRASTATDATVLVVDDGSPDWDPEWDRSMRERHDGRLLTIRFDGNGGLTRSWNTGVATAVGLGLDYCCVSNSDVIFGEGWDAPLVAALSIGYSLVGPLTNAPGASPRQDVRRFLPDYTPSDSPVAVDAVARSMAKNFPAHRTPTPVNGFCMMASCASWASGSYSAALAFKPKNDFNSKGDRNPTPLMTLNEDELQARWRELGRKSCCCDDSFVFHYRSATRGDRHAKGQGFRPPA